MKNLLLMIAGLLAITLIGLHAAPAKVFHHYTATDNGDSCITPEEANSTILAEEGIERVKVWDDPKDIDMFIKNITQDGGTYDMDKLVVYDVSPVYPDTYYVLTFYKGCMNEDVMMNKSDFDNWLQLVFGEEVNFIGHENHFFKGKEGYDPAAS